MPEGVCGAQHKPPLVTQARYPRSISFVGCVLPLVAGPDWCRLTDMWGCLLVQLSARLGYDYCGYAGEWDRLLACLIDRPGCSWCGHAGVWGWPLAQLAIRPGRELHEHC